jgi:RNA polymerase sigma-70 factor (ECF subfamily)
MELIFTKSKLRSDTKNLSDAERIEAILNRDEFQTGRIYSQYRDEFINFLRKMIKNEDDYLQDIYSEAFCKLCDKIYNNTLNASTLTSSLKSYLFGIGKFMMMEHRRKLKNGALVILSEIPDLEDNDSAVMIENEKIVAEALEQLGEPCHSLLVKKYWEGKSGEEIAVELNYKNADSVKTQRYRCMDKLRVQLINKITFN